MSGAQRFAQPAKRNAMRPPPPRPFSRAQSATPALRARVSSSDSLLSDGARASKQGSPPGNGAGIKRKERDFERELAEETNINVVVRCRGRSDREVKENSGVVVSTDNIKGKAVELSMGPNALSNKTYNFDRVFSPAADQAMVFEEVVAPILDEVVNGFNCTIFAYGQTGTGKTYTMSGEVTDILPLPDEAGIIPRVLHSLFNKLENDDRDSTVKCSFIELYNEELRDLQAPDDNVKLKIFDDANRKSHTATLVQGMEETHIDSASKGLQLLRTGSHKRQVAATKCNDLSSRSHTIFTITIYIKRRNEAGEDYVCSGKLNLVDLAGSENIQRSGAENKRAAEAGLINKSLLTLGRVINALVDKNAHIPYRESKLTRLLQDSLGGRTKTCIIATLSPAKSNLEETISTLDYAFRAKNIRNKPQVNPTVMKKTLIREFTSEIEKLKAELIATRQRNGVYLTGENYEELTTESESRRILTEEQRDKIETMEANLRNKAQELFSLTSNLTNLKKDHEGTRTALNSTQDVLEKTEIALKHTEQSLSEEEMLRRAHEETEDKLTQLGHGMIAQLGKTTYDIGALHDKNKRKSDLQTLNRTNWTSSQNQVADTTHLVDQRLSDFEAKHQQLIGHLSARIQSFVQDKLSKFEESKTFLDEKSDALDRAEKEVNEQTATARDEMNGVLQGIESLREDVKHEVGQGLDGLSAAAQKISAGVVQELEDFHNKLHSSYTSLGRDFRKTFDDLSKRLISQQSEADDLRRQLTNAGDELAQVNSDSSAKLKTTLAEERQQGAKDREYLLSQVTALVNNFGGAQESRLETKVSALDDEVTASTLSFKTKQDSYSQSMDDWLDRAQQIQEHLLKSRESIKSEIQKNRKSANTQTTSIQTTTKSVHAETVRIVDAQMRQMDTQLHSLDDIVSKIRKQNAQHHDTHTQSLQTLGRNVKDSYNAVGERLADSTERAGEVSAELDARVEELGDVMAPLREEVGVPLEALRGEICGRAIVEYVPTGATPAKDARYSYPKRLPRTQAHERLIQRLRDPDGMAEDENDDIAEGDGIDEGTQMGIWDWNDGLLAACQQPVLNPGSPTKALIYTDADSALSPSKTRAKHEKEGENHTTSLASPLLTKKLKNVNAGGGGAGGLRELDLNREENKTVPIDMPMVTKKVLLEGKDFSSSIGPGAKGGRKAEGRENVPPRLARSLRSREKVERQ